MTMFTDEEKLAEALREIRQRQRVYPRLINLGKMTTRDAERKLAIMEAIRRDYEVKVKSGHLFDRISGSP